jgi:hypothetical protein
VSSDDALTEEAVSEQQKLVRELMAESVVDLPVHLDDLLSQAESDNWAATIAAKQLSRGSWWRWSREPLEDLLVIFRRVADHHPEALPMWQTAAMSGAADNYRMNPKGASVVLAVVAAVGFDDDVNVASAQQGLVRAAEVAEYFNVPDPAEYIVPAIRILHEMDRVSDPEAWLERFLAEP